MPDPKKKKAAIQPEGANTVYTNGTKKVASDKDKVVKKKAKKYNVTVSARTKKMEKDGRMQHAREKQFKKDVEAAGGMDAYIKKYKKAKKATPARRA